jgi:hypothetical protein
MIGARLNVSFHVFPSWKRLVAAYIHLMGIEEIRCRTLREREKEVVRMGF